jgi:RNA polymerase sigma factor (sigma-70 family)
VDLVYSAAFRMTGQAHAAQDVTQSVFLALAQNAARLAGHPVLSGWLHCTARNLAANTVRAAVRRQHHEQEAAMNQLLCAETEPPWAQVAPQLDAALGELDDAERDAILLRYFEKKSAADMAAQIGISAEAAQKRVSRAVERLRQLFAKRGISAGAGGLVAVISANAVQGAPAGMAAAISTAALTGAAFSHSTIIAVATTKTVAMTTLQKAAITATFAVLAGGGLYEARHASQLRTQVETLQQAQAPLADQLQQLQQERADAADKLTEASNRIAELSQHAGPLTSELVRLRAETAQLRAASQTSGERTATAARATRDVSQLMQEANQLWQAGKLLEARAAFEAVVKVDPKISEAWNGLGWADFNSGKAADAEKAFKQALELLPDHPAALNGLGQIYLSKKKYAEAEEYLLKAGPKAGGAWYGLTRLYLLQDRFEDAEQWAQRIIDSGQGNEMVRAMLKAAKDRKVSDGLRLMLDPQ